MLGSVALGRHRVEPLTQLLGVVPLASGGRSDSPSASPKIRSKLFVVRYSTGAPAPSPRPASSIRPRSSRPATAASAETPRMRAISGRPTGCR